MHDCRFAQNGNACSDVHLLPRSLCYEPSSSSAVILPEQVFMHLKQPSLSFSTLHACPTVCRSKSCAPARCCLHSHPNLPFDLIDELKRRCVKLLGKRESCARAPAPRASFLSSLWLRQYPPSRWPLVPTCLPAE
eukprot:6189664-Pleurochrysis_carterae.AAC.2